MLEKCLKVDDVYIKLTGDKELYMISENLANKILEQLDIKYNHIGARKTWLIFRENYISTTDMRLIKNITNKCEICQILKSKNYKNQNIPRNIIPKGKLDIIAIDFLGELIESNNGNKFILAIVDLFSKLIKTYPCKRTTVDNIKHCLENYFQEIGKPKHIIMDNATYFQNNRFKKYCKQNNIMINIISIRHPQSNPSERYIQEILKFLRIHVQNNHKYWDNELENMYFKRS